MQTSTGLFDLKESCPIDVTLFSMMTSIIEKSPLIHEAGSLLVKFDIWPVLSTVRNEDATSFDHVKWSPQFPDRIEQSFLSSLSANNSRALVTKASASTTKDKKKEPSSLCTTLMKRTVTHLRIPWITPFVSFIFIKRNMKQ